MVVPFYMQFLTGVFNMSKNKNVISTDLKKKYRAALAVALCVNILAAVLYYIWYIDRKIPDSIMLIEDREENLEFNVPIEGEIDGAVDAISIKNPGSVQNDNIHFNLNKTVIMKAANTGSYKARLKLFGLFHYKNIQIDVIKEQKVMPSGRAAGLYINSDGIMVLGTSEIVGKDGLGYEPSANILRAGDYIYKVNNNNVDDIDDVIEALQENGGNSVTVYLRRDGNNLKVKIDPVLTADGEYKIGVWLREDTEGIGTITYITEDNKYAALGHGITDIDTGLLIDIKNGGVYPAKINQIVRGQAGTPGEILGSVKLGKTFCLGTISNNTNYGISGEIFDDSYGYDGSKAIPAAMKQEVFKGKATVRCQLGDRTGDYEVEIEKININSEENKGMVIKVTDKRLLDKAGGIIQGMSGSPIIQNNKIIGAVTHVFVNDPVRGYGIFIEDMLSG
ncbi:MAG TPA: SpoIVB peptidase [Lachnospiraceae bacterium]|nr:SpoIVB peptidase [Lachnospiraceae bacterium]